MDTLTRPKTGHILTALRTLIAPGQVFELRAMGCSTRERRSTHVRSGYFDSDHLEAAAAAAEALTALPPGAAAVGVYFTLNPLLTDLLARRANRVEIADREYRPACDADVVSRRWLLLDCDPCRPAGVSASDTEFNAARLFARSVNASLDDAGWPEPIVAQSGNGYHLLYRVDLPTDDGGLIKRCLQALAAKHNTPQVTIDQKVFNPGRICKLYGTFSRKGDHTEDRPHRRSAIVRAPATIQTVPVELLQILASGAPPEPSRGHRRQQSQPSSSSVIERARRYVEHLPESVDGQGGHDKAYRAACELIRGFSLSIEHAWPLLLEFNERCQPPWSERELQHKLEQAERHAQGEPGYLLTSPRSGVDPHGEQPSYGQFEIPPLFTTEPVATLPDLPDLEELLPSLPATSPVTSPATANTTFQAESSSSGPAPVTSPVTLPVTATEISGDASGLNEADDDPFRLARLFLCRFHHRDGLMLRYWRETYWVWPGYCWRPISDAELRTAVHSAIENEFASINRQRLASIADPSKPAPAKLKTTLAVTNNTLAAIQSLTLLPDVTEMPAWIGGELSNRPVHDFVPCLNGLLDLAAEQRRQQEFITDGSEDGFLQPLPTPILPHTPALFSAVCLPVTYDPAADCPTWNQFLVTSLESDPEKTSLLQEWFGYCLTPDTSQQRFLMLEGEGRNGKSVVCAALTALLGDKNVSQIRLEQFDDDYSLAETLGKLANIVSEVGEVDRVAEGVLKSFTAGDRIMSNRKFKSYLSFVPTAKLILATNNRPRFSDRSGGLWRRMLILPLDHYVTDAERVYGMDQQSFWSAAELSGILNWALRGLFALREQRGFTIPAASQLAIDDYREEANPCREFLNEHYAQSDGGWIMCSDVYSEYKDWCKEHGVQALNSRNFGKEVRRVFPLSERIRPGTGNTRPRAYSNIVRTDASISDFTIELPDGF